MVKKGVTRAFGSRLRSIIGRATDNRLTAFGAGLGVTTLLQSSTATILLLISFAKSGIIGLSSALAIVIGADVGTTIAAQVLSFDLSFLSPALLSFGIILFMMSKDGAFRTHIARIFIGLGLMLLSLSLVREAVTPIKESELLPTIIGRMGDDTFFTFLIAGGLTWLVHSSLASVLLFASFISSGLIDLHLGLLLILGANLGGAFIALTATWKDGATARRITCSNAAMRAITIILVMPFLGMIETTLQGLDDSIMRQAIHFHTAFNVGLALIFLPLIGLVGRIFTSVIPDTVGGESEDVKPQFLDPHALDSPAVAVSLAARETLHIAEHVQHMLEQSIKAFEENDLNIIKNVRKYDDAVDTLYRAVKIYVAKLSQESMEEKDAFRVMQILNFSTNLEHIGDIIDKSLMELAEKKIKQNLSFSKEGRTEIQQFSQQVFDNLKLAQNVFMTADENLARQLITEKRKLRDSAHESTEQHFKRIGDGINSTLETSSIHLDIIRDFHRINTHITRLAYLILDK